MTIYELLKPNRELIKKLNIDINGLEKFLSEKRKNEEREIRERDKKLES